MEKTITTIKKIFEEHYKVKLKLQWAENLIKEEFLLWNKHQNFFMHSRKLRQVVFPIFNSKRQLEVLATVKPVFKENRACFNEMADFLNLTVTEPLRLRGIYQEQNQKEDILQRFFANPGKVIPFKIKRPIKALGKTNGLLKKQMVSCNNKLKRLKSKKETGFDPIWILGDKNSVNTKIALCVHELSSNWAFINTKNFSDLIWENPKDWGSFPQVTVLIPEIQTLSDSKVAHLHDSLKFIRRLKDKPLLIVTSSRRLSGKLKELKPLFKNCESNEKIPPFNQAQTIL